MRNLLKRDKDYIVSNWVYRRVTKTNFIFTLTLQEKGRGRPKMLLYHRMPIGKDGYIKGVASDMREWLVYSLTMNVVHITQEVFNNSSGLWSKTKTKHIRYMDLRRNVTWSGRYFIRMCSDLFTTIYICRLSIYTTSLRD